MIDNETILFDRLQKIKQIINKYGVDNFYIAFSGGKDSTVLSALIDMALPANKIPRVYANTGIELNMIRDFVLNLHDDRVVILQPETPIKPMLERDGYPFKSKYHARCVNDYKRSNGQLVMGKNYYECKNKRNERNCPKMLRYQFETELPFKISPLCCNRLKKEPLHKWAIANNKPYFINGIMADEGGQRNTAKCLALSSGKLKGFQPLAPITKEWEEWFIAAYSITICDIYKPPYSFHRTGCKGCPFAIDLQHELDILEKFFPEERKQCEIIWKPVYEEYRRIGYRLKPYKQMSIEDYMKGDNT